MVPVRKLSKKIHLFARVLRPLQGFFSKPTFINKRKCKNAKSIKFITLV